MDFPEEELGNCMFKIRSKLRINYKKMFLEGLIDINLNNQVCL